MIKDEKGVGKNNSSLNMQAVIIEEVEMEKVENDSPRNPCGYDLENQQPPPDYLEDKQNKDPKDKTKALVKSPCITPKEKVENEKKGEKADLPQDDFFDINNIEENNPNRIEIRIKNAESDKVNMDLTQETALSPDIDENKPKESSLPKDQI